MSMNKYEIILSSLYVAQNVLQNDYKEENDRTISDMLDNLINEVEEIVSYLES